MTVEAAPVPTAVPVTGLVMHARDGDQRARDAIVERYAPLVWSLCRGYWLADADQAGQAVWLQMMDHIGQIRDPAAHRPHRSGGDHRHRGPPARLRRADPRHRRQPRLRVYPVAQDR